MKMYLHFDIGLDYVLFQFWKPTTTLGECFLQID